MTNLEQCVDLLRQMVAIPSESGNEAAFAAFLERFLREELKLESYLQHIEGSSYNVIGRWSDGKPHARKLVLGGHIDTVSPTSCWRSDPYRLLEQNGSLWGLGAADMKGGLASQLMVLKRLKDEGAKLDADVEFVGLADEERYSIGAHAYVDWFRAHHIPNQKTFFIMGEPHYEDIVIGAAGKVLLLLQVHGEEGHAATPEKGINAIECMAAFLEAILSGVFSDAPEQLIQNARFLTIEYACERFLCIVEAAPMGAFAGGAFVGHINEYFTSMRRRFLLLQQGGSRLIYVVESDVSRRALEELEQLVLPQLECLASNSAGLQLRVGVSSHFPSLSELQQAFSEADFSLQLGGKMDPGKTLYFYSDYLLYHLLDSIKQTSAISLIYSEVITVLSDYDRQNNTELLDTLLSLCQNNFNAIQAADKMYLHRNSLYKRIERITSILDMDLDLPDNIIVLHLAAKLHELLN